MHKKIFLLLLLPLNSVFAQKGEMNFIWYSKPATVFEDALPVGNGRIGGMVYGGIEKERISLNESFLWVGYSVDPNMNPDAKQFLPMIRTALFRKLRKAVIKPSGNITDKVVYGNKTCTVTPNKPLIINL